MQTLDHPAAGMSEEVDRSPRPRVGFPLPSQMVSAQRILRRQKLLCRAIVPLRLLGRRLKQAVGILTYHRVDDVRGTADGVLCVSPQQFYSQMEGLLSMGYEPWSLRKLVACHRQGDTISRNAFVVVFDDGYESVYHNAWPVLRRFKIPATVFLATAYLDRDHAFPFETPPAECGLDAARTFRPLRSEHCAEMLASGLVDLGTHTHSHFDFRRRPHAFRDDLAASLSLLRERFGITEATFAFPYGFAGPELIAAAKQTDILCALTAQCRLVTPRCDPYHWGRFGASEFDSARSLAAKLDGWYSFLQDAWHQVRSPWREMGGR